MTAASAQPQANEVLLSRKSTGTVPLAAFDLLRAKFPDYRHKHVWSSGESHHFRINRYTERTPEEGGLSEVYIADSRHIVVKVFGDQIEYRDITRN